MDVTEFRQQLIDAIADNSIVLPTLPEVALQVRDAAEKENTTAREIADIIATDAAISARLLQVANSPLYRPRTPIENVQMAVTRLGNQMVKNLVTSLAMKQIYQATSDYTEKMLRKAWEDSVQVAAVSKVLAQAIPELENEQAMLAGLVHNIGILPILTMAEASDDAPHDQASLQVFVDQLYPEIGHIILEQWDFPEMLAAVPLEHRNLQRTRDNGPDFADLVLVARLQLGLDSVDDWSRISAFTRVGLDTDVQIVDIEGTAEEIDQVKQALE
ncbi:MAG: HDOD domain-containing protein [Chromatiales bacterium]|jgi:HD-like signal output (HDOD) protein